MNPNHRTSERHLTAGSTVAAAGAVLATALIGLGITPTARADEWSVGGDGFEYGSGDTTVNVGGTTGVSWGSGGSVPDAEDALKLFDNEYLQGWDAPYIYNPEASGILYPASAWSYPYWTVGEDEEFVQLNLQLMHLLELVYGPNLAINDVIWDDELTLIHGVPVGPDWDLAADVGDLDYHDLLIF